MTKKVTSIQDYLSRKPKDLLIQLVDLGVKPTIPTSREELIEARKILITSSFMEESVALIDLMLKFADEGKVLLGNNNETC